MSMWPSSYARSHCHQSECKPILRGCKFCRTVEICSANNRGKDMFYHLYTMHILHVSYFSKLVLIPCKLRLIISQLQRPNSDCTRKISLIRAISLKVAIPSARALLQPGLKSRCPAAGPKSWCSSSSSPPPLLFVDLFSVCGSADRTEISRDGYDSFYILIYIVYYQNPHISS